jgi:cell division septum initiation protein DivIVA
LIDDAQRRAADIRDRAERESRQLLDDAARHHERLIEHERALRARVDAIERVLAMLRSEIAGATGDFRDDVEESPNMSAVVDLRNRSEGNVRGEPKKTTGPPRPIRRP